MKGHLPINKHRSIFSNNTLMRLLCLSSITVLVGLVAADGAGEVMHVQVANEKDLTDAIDKAVYCPLLIIDVLADIQLSKSLVIFGQYNPFTWIRGGGHKFEMVGSSTNDGMVTKKRCFQITNYAHMNISNLIITGGHTLYTGSSPMGGGAIQIDSSTLHLVNCEFRNNQAEEISGGAVYAANSQINIIGCTFVYNIASSPEGSIAGSNGGAMFLSGSKATIDSSTFDSNRCFYKGGATKGGGKAE